MGYTTNDTFSSYNSPDQMMVKWYHNTTLANIAEGISCWNSYFRPAMRYNIQVLFIVIRCILINIQLDSMVRKFKAFCKYWFTQKYSFLAYLLSNTLVQFEQIVLIFYSTVWKNLQTNILGTQSRNWFADLNEDLYLYQKDTP